MKTYCKPVFNVSNLTVEERLACSGVFDTKCSTIYYSYSKFNTSCGGTGIKGTFSIDKGKDGDIDENGTFKFFRWTDFVKWFDRYF